MFSLVLLEYVEYQISLLLSLATFFSIANTATVHRSAWWWGSCIFSQFSVRLTLSSHSISSVLDICLGSCISRGWEIRNNVQISPASLMDQCKARKAAGRLLRYDNWRDHTKFICKGVGQGLRQPGPDGALLCCGNIREPWCSLNMEVQVEGRGAVKGCIA